ncbi:uncharacterized protein [Miscanthus floridulus]|uniref:uncharacterized protein n=1 Tax=Miscanthus floridulus TaxID=154761 RepID=UPI00345B05DA
MNANTCRLFSQRSLISRYLAEFKSGAERKDAAVRTMNAYNAAQAYMFKYDSTHGPFKGSIKVVDVSTLEINGKQIKLQAKSTACWQW